MQLMLQLGNNRYQKNIYISKREGKKKTSGVEVPCSQGQREIGQPTAAARGLCTQRRLRLLTLLLLLATRGVKKETSSVLLFFWEESSVSLLLSWFCF